MRLTITSVHEQLFDGEVYSVNCPGEEGEFTILQGHVPFISTLKKGEIRVRKSSDDTYTLFQVDKGLLEVNNSGVTILI